MNAVRRAKLEEFKKQGMSPKMAYVEVMKLKLKGRRKTDGQ